MQVYEVHWNCKQGIAEWKDDPFYFAKNIGDLSGLLRRIREELATTECYMRVTFAQILDKDLRDAERDITSLLPQDLLNY